MFDPAAIVICFSRKPVETETPPARPWRQVRTVLERSMRGRKERATPRPIAAPKVELTLGELKTEARLVSCDVHEVRLDTFVGADPGQRVVFRIADENGATLRLAGVVRASRRFGVRYRLRISLQPDTAHAVMMRRLFLNLVEG